MSGFYPSPPFPQGTPSELTRTNSSNPKVFGIELEAQGQIARKVRGLVDYAYQDAKGTGETSFAFVVPKHKINVGANVQLSSRWDAFIGAHFVGSMDVLQTGAGKTTLTSYTRVDMRVGCHFGTQARPWSLSVIATNLFDDRHLEFPVSTPGMSGQQRRTVYLALKGGF